MPDTIFLKHGVVTFPSDLAGDCELADFHWKCSGITWNSQERKWYATMKMWENHGVREITMPIDMPGPDEEAVNAAIMQLAEFSKSTVV